MNNDHPQVIEIWNNVFIQFNRLKDGSLQPLPARHVDTGMGFERLVRVIQRKDSNYDTDVFTGTIAAIEKMTGRKYDAGHSREAIAFRVLADHIRAIAFTIADGQLPSNTGAGYVIRRILRRAVRYYYSYLDCKEPLLYRLIPVLAEQFEGVFSELKFQQDFIMKVVKDEEEAFLRTLALGIKRFNQYSGDPSLATEQAAAITAGMELYKTDRAAKRINGDFAFELFDTFGFPIDLTRLMADEIGWLVDMDGFTAALQQQKTRSRAATVIDAGDWTIVNNLPPSGFAGDEVLETASRIVKYRKVAAKGKESFQLVLDTTPFYAESGGQVGDTGVLVSGGEVIAVNDTKKENDQVIHFTGRLPSDLTAMIRAKVDSEKRGKTAVHHSATHLLHAALRQVLGSHVAQKGSLVSEQHLRFDFSHFSKMTAAEIADVETRVNEKVRQNIPVSIRLMPKEAAMETGAMALFGEKYGDTVRVVTMDPAYSVELCGGTHVHATGELGYFKIKHETAVAAGVRRIEAVSGEAAQEFVNQQLDQLQQVKEQLKNPAVVTRAVEALLAENNVLQKKLEHMEDRMLVGIRNELLHKDEIINGVVFIGSLVEVGNPDALKKLCTEVKNKLRACVVVLGANIGGKPFVAVGVSDTVVAARQLDAAKMIKEVVAPLIRGGGGGQKTLASAGGTEAGGLPAVLEKIKDLLLPGKS